MNTVYKYVIPIEDEFEIEMPQGAKILSFQMQNGTPCIWALVDTDAWLEFRHFRLAGTGHPLNNAESLTFVGTIQIKNLVFHLFESSQ